jgi:hypothetical protein
MELRLAVYEDPDRAGVGAGQHRWVARALSYDFIGESLTRDGAIRNLVVAVAAEYQAAKREGRKPFQGLPKTPRDFVTWWERGKLQHLDVAPEIMAELPEAWMIEAMERQQAVQLG